MSEASEGTAQANNTDRHLWPQVSEDYYSPRIFATAEGGIGIDVAGHVIVRPVHAWHRLAREASDFEEYPYDDERFNKGVELVVDMLAKAIGVTNWTSGDGSEDYECDLGQTLLNILEAKGLYDSETAQFAKPDSEVEKLRLQLVYARKAISDIKQATIDGLVCDDVAWFDTITTLHDFCDQTLDHLTDEHGK